MLRTYENAPRKRAARELMLPRNQFNTIIGLPGPNMDICVADYRDRGFKEMLLWETNPKVFVNQVAMLPMRGVTLSLGDIMDAPVLPRAFYDLDFCVSVFNVGQYIDKFRKNFALTICMRSTMGAKMPDQLAHFAKARGERFMSIKEISKCNYLIKTTKGHYLAVTYADGAPMMCIKPI